MNALVTGGAGFIGSHLVEALLARGDAVFVIDDLSTGKEANLHGWSGHDNLHLEIGRVEETPALEGWMPEMDLVFHLAAAVGVRLVINNRVRTLYSNLHGTEAVLEYASRSQVPVFLASSSEVYGAADSVPFAEDQSLLLGSPDAGRWGYAASKAMGEFLALACAKERGLPVVIGRLFNTTGPRQTAAYGMVLPTFVHQALSSEPITVFGDGTQTRCFAHVSDVVRAILALMDTPAAQGEIFNIGGDAEISMEALAHRVKALTGSSSEITFLPYTEVWDDFVDMQRRVPDLSKIHNTIGYRPTRGLDEVIMSAIDYARSAGDR